MLLFIILLVVAPIVWKLFPIEVANWEIAKARNQIRRLDLDKAGTILQDLQDSRPAVLKYPTFLIAKSDLAIARGKPDEVLEYYEKFSMDVDHWNRIRAGELLSEYFYQLGDFSRSYKLLKQCYGDRRLERDSLNRYAYAKALAKVDLESALENITMILGSDTDGSLKDTRGWVLYQMGEYYESVIMMNEAIAATTTVISKQGYFAGIDTIPKDEKNLSTKDQKSLEALREEMKTTHAISDLRERRNRFLATPVSHLAILHYHRAKALDALESEKAQADWDWLRFHGFEDESVLY